MFWAMNAAQEFGDQQRLGGDDNQYQFNYYYFWSKKKNLGSLEATTITHCLYRMNR